MAVHGLQIAAQLWPEEYRMWIDGKATMKALMDKMRIELVKFRNPAQVNEVLDRMQKLAGVQALGQRNPTAVSNQALPSTNGAAGAPQ